MGHQMRHKPLIWGARTAAALAALCAAAPAGAAAIPPGDFSGRVTLADGRGVHLECRGAGPVVVLVSGLRGRADSWSSVVPRASRVARVCSYDRPGTTSGPGAPSRSDPVPMPRSAGEAAVELDALLRAAELPPPYVLAGHSTGGLIARLYARSHPGSVAGLVMVDAIPETMQDAMKPRQFAFYDRRYLQDVPPELAGYADLERIDFRSSFAQIRRAPRPPRAVPAVVLSKARPWGAPPGVSRRFARFVDRVWDEGQRRLGELFAGSPRWTAGRSGHLIQVRQPKLVVRAIRRVLAG